MSFLVMFLGASRGGAAPGAAATPRAEPTKAGSAEYSYGKVYLQSTTISCTPTLFNDDHSSVRMLSIIIIISRIQSIPLSK